MNVFSLLNSESQPLGIMIFFTAVFSSRDVTSGRLSCVWSVWCAFYCRWPLTVCLTAVALFDPLPLTSPCLIWQLWIMRAWNISEFALERSIVTLLVGACLGSMTWALQTPNTFFPYQWDGEQTEAGYAFIAELHLRRKESHLQIYNVHYRRLQAFIMFPYQKHSCESPSHCLNYKTLYDKDFFFT